MKASYRPGPVHQHYGLQLHNSGLGDMQASAVKQEPGESPSRAQHELPVDMSLTQREAAYQSFDPHMTSSPFRISPSSVSTMSLPGGLNQFSEENRYNQRLFQAQISASMDQHVMSTSYSQHLYTHSHMPEETQARATGSNKRKQSTPLPCPPSTPSIHRSPSSQASDADEPMPKMRAGSDPMMNLSVELGKDWRSSPINTEPRLQPRASAGHQRARREFVPEDKKDTSYWCKRLKNNDSARRSRVKRKALEKLMEARLLELQKENIELRHEMAAMERRYNVKSNIPTDTLQPPAGFEDISQTDSHDSPSPPSVDKLAREEELECASAGSDDSRSNDDSRVYSVGTVSALHRSLGPASRERTDSGTSTTSSLASLRSAASSLVSSSATSSSPVIRLDKTGALDLTSDHSNRSTPARDSPDIIKSRPFSGISQGSDTPSTLEDAAMAMRSMKNFPLKCRWKREMQSAHGSPGEERRECQ